MTFIQTIIKHAGKYLSGSLIASLTGLLMTKYYTAVFSPAEFGILALYLVMFQYVLTFVSLDMQNSATRFYFDYRLTQKNEYLSTIFWVITLMAVVVLGVGIGLSSIISNWISPGSEVIYLTTLISGIAAVYVTFLTRILYNEQESTLVLKHSIFQTAINHLSSYAFISYFNLGILGRLSGQALGATLNVLALLKGFYANDLFRLKLCFNKKMAKETILLAAPTMMVSLQGLLFIYLDRIFLKHYIGDSAVGIYTFGFIIGQGLSVTYEAISQAILPKVFNDMKSDYEKAKTELQSFSYIYYIGLVLITIIISVLSPVIVNVFSNENYAESAIVIPFVMAGFMMGGFYKIPSLMLNFHKIVWFYPFLAFFSFGSNALLNWLLIPLYGVVGAAFSSFIGLYLYSITLQVFSFKYMDNKYSILTMIGYFVILIIVSVLFYFQG